MSRLNILKEKEILLFDSPREFSPEDRIYYFTLPDSRMIFRKIETKIGYILQEGYFKSQQKFILPSQYHNEDIEYVTALCGVKRSINIKKDYNKFAYNRWKQFILEKYGYTSFSACKDLIGAEATRLVKSASKANEIFYDLIDFLVKNKIEIPKYYSLVELITQGFKSFEKELLSIVDNALSEEQKELLDGFMYLLRDNKLEPSAQNPYLITHLKKAEQTITPAKIKESLEDFNYIQELYKKLSDFYDFNLISNELINYYAIWVLKAEHIQFNDISDMRNKRLYVLSFILYQYKIRQDYFLDTYLQSVQKYFNDVQNNIARRFLDQNLKIKKQEQFGKIRGILSGSRTERQEISKIIFSNSLDELEKIHMLQQLLLKTGLKIEDEIAKELDMLENTGAKNLKDQLLYEELENGYRRLANRVAKIVLVLNLNPINYKPEVYQAIRYYQQYAGKIREEDAPVDFIPKKECKRLFSQGDGFFNANLYRIFLFKAIFDGIRSGELNLLLSERYQSVDDYLIPTKRWNQEREALIARAGFHDLDIAVQDIINSLKISLKEQYRITNVNLKDNEHIKFDSKGIAKVTTPKKDDQGEGATAAFIGRDKLFSLTHILSDIAYYVDYLSSFTHYNRKNVKSSPSSQAIYAAIIALGCNIEIRKMGKISEGISADVLEYIVRWFFSKENVDDANRKVIALIDSLPLSGIYLDKPEQVNTSSDGQKFNVGIPSLNATHSPKYFGMDKIVSAYSSIDAKGRLSFGTVHSAKERESNFVPDALLNNPDVVSDTHATDTHGYTEIVFGICYLLGVEFTPRIKNYHQQILYTFKDMPRKAYESKKYKILPAKTMYINEKIIVEQWDQILRFLCTIKLRETLPSNILKRLSSYSRQHPLHKALKEVGRIYKTYFLLRFYDELPLRQNIEKQLNRIESSHLFAHAVFFGGNQEFNYATKQEQDLALGCRHLIQNIIVLWNYMFVSQKLSEITDLEERQNQIDVLKTSSIITWQHINMHGQYDFKINTEQRPFDIDSVKNLIVS